MMKSQGQLLPEQKHILKARRDAALQPADDVVFTRDHDVIKDWAAKRHAEPATGEATNTGPATVSVNDGGAGIRFNFPGSARFRPIAWDEWLSNFDRHDCAFVYDGDSTEGTISNRYRIVNASDWKEMLD